MGENIPTDRRMKWRDRENKHLLRLSFIALKIVGDKSNV